MQSAAARAPQQARAPQLGLPAVARAPAAREASPQMAPYWCWRPAPRAGSKGARFTLLAAPSAISSARASPVAGPLSIPL